MLGLEYKLGEPKPKTAGAESGSLSQNGYRTLNQYSFN